MKLHFKKQTIKVELSYILKCERFFCIYNLRIDTRVKKCLVTVSLSQPQVPSLIREFNQIEKIVLSRISRYLRQTSILTRCACAYLKDF